MFVTTAAAVLLYSLTEHYCTLLFVFISRPHPHFRAPTTQDHIHTYPHQMMGVTRWWEWMEPCPAPLGVCVWCLLFLLSFFFLCVDVSLIVLKNKNDRVITTSKQTRMWRASTLWKIALPKYGKISCCWCYCCCSDATRMYDTSSFRIIQQQ